MCCFPRRSPFPQYWHCAWNLVQLAERSSGSLQSQKGKRPYQMLLRRGQDLIDKQRSDKRGAHAVSQSIRKLERLTRAFGSITQCADSLWYDAASALFNIASCVCVSVWSILIYRHSSSSKSVWLSAEGNSPFPDARASTFSASAAFRQTAQRHVAFYFHVTAEILPCRPKIACKIANERRTHARTNLPYRLSLPRDAKVSSEAAPSEKFSSSPFHFSKAWETRCKYATIYIGSSSLFTCNSNL